MLNSEIAINASKLYVEKKYNPFKSNGHFNYHLVCVGETETQPSEIYVETFSNELYANIEQVKDEFFKKPTFQKEYLIKVNIKKSTEKMICEIIREPL